MIDVVVAEMRRIKREPTAGRRAASREGSPEGLPDAQPGEHLQPHVAPGASGDLLRSPRHARRDAGRASSAVTVRGRAARRGATCSRTARSAVTVSDRTPSGLSLPPERLRWTESRDCPLHASPRWARIWSDRRRFETWLEVETGRRRGHGGRRHRSAGRGARDPRKGDFDVARIDEIEKIDPARRDRLHDRVAEHVGPAARWLHFGLTSSDVVDTALALQMREASDLILRGIVALLRGGPRARAEEHRHTPMIGRTHGVHAEPMTFGFKLALWYAELQRDVGALRRARDDDRGRARSRAPSARSRTSIPRSKPPSAPARASQPAPVSSQVIQRDRHAELLRAGASPPPRSRSSRSRSAACRKPRSARSRSRSARARRARRRCRTSATRSAASRSSGWRGWCAATRWRRSRTSRSGTSATSRTRRSSA